jgi:hypothetical protein
LKEGAKPNKYADKLLDKISSVDLKKILTALKAPMEAAQFSYKVFQKFVGIMSGPLGSESNYFFLFSLCLRPDKMIVRNFF